MLPLLVVLLASATAATTLDVCVVGAGPAGIGAALALADKGKSVALLDRAAVVGGQTAFEYRDPATGFRVHMGAIVLVPPDYPRVMALAARVGLGIRAYSPGVTGSAWLTPGGTPVPLTAETLPRMLELQQRGLADTPGLLAALRRYGTVHAALRFALRAPGGLGATLALAPELGANYDEWMVANDFSVLLPFASQFLLQSGYGHAYQTSAASALKYLTPFTLLCTLGTFGVNVSPALTLADRTDATGRVWNSSMYLFDGDAGFMELLSRAAALLPAGALRLGANITGVQRPAAGVPGPVTVSYHQGGVAQVVECGQLVVAVPQTVSNLGWLGLDEAEISLFSKVVACNYFTSAVVVSPPLPTGVTTFPTPFPSWAALLAPLARRLGWRSALPQPAAPLVAALSDPFPYRGDATAFWSVVDASTNRPPGVPFSANPGLGVVYSYSDDPATTPAQVAARARTALRGGGRRVDVRATLQHSYYPRVSEAALQAGWFARAAALQGRRSTFFCGGLFSFWDVEEALGSGQDLVALYF